MKGCVFGSSSIETSPARAIFHAGALHHFEEKKNKKREKEGKEEKNKDERKKDLI